MAQPEHEATEIKIEDLPFFSSLRIVEERTGLNRATLLKRQVGFKATPAQCAACSHEWNAFDLIIEVVRAGPHKWDFFKKNLVGDTAKFFYRTTDLTCNCGVKAHGIGVLYDYTGQPQWG